eukprot:9816788-Alexandrium_andersonii.AAC.1
MTAPAPPTPWSLRAAPPPSNRMYVHGSPRSIGATSDELSVTTWSPARPAWAKVRVARWQRHAVHHSVDHHPRTQRPAAGGRRLAQGAQSGPGPGQCAGA